MNVDESKALSSARAIAIVLVVLGHAVTNDIRSIEPGIDFIRTIIYSFHMFFFFFVSGMLFEKGKNRYENNVYSFIKKKFNLLIVPYIAITIIEYIGLFAVNVVLNIIGKEARIANISIESFCKAVILNEGHFDTHLWYVYLLFFMFALNIMIFRKSVPIGVFVVSVLLVLIYPALSAAPWKLQSLIYYIIPFGLGRLLYSRNFVKFSIEQRKVKIIMCGICVVLLTGVIFYLEQIYTGDLLGIPYIRAGIPQIIRYITGALGSLILFYCGHVLEKNAILEKILRQLDKYSYGIYLYHQPFVTVGCVTILMKLKCPIIVSIFISLCAGIIVPVALCRFVIRKNPLLCKVFLGNR